MGVFFVLLFFPIMLQHITIKGHYVEYQKRNRLALLIFFVVLTFLVMLRHESIGNDTRNYIHFFERYCWMGWERLHKETLETGFVFYNKAISLFTRNSQVFLAVTAIFSSVMIYSTYKRLCLDASLTIVLFCTMSTFVLMFSGIRQMLAIGLGFVAYEFVREKRLLSFALTVLVALTIHTSAFMLVLMYPVYHAKITKKWLYVVVPTLILVFVFNKPIFASLTFILERYTKYSGAMTATGAYTMLILFAAFSVFAFLIPEESRLDEETVGLRNFLLLSLTLQMFAPLHTLAMRMNYYYIIFIPLLLPKIIECRSKRWNKVAKFGRHLMVVFFLAYFFVNAYRGGALNVFPYRFFWENRI